MALLDLLQSQGKMTLDELSTGLNVSERTIRRDIQKLQSLDVQLEVTTGRTGGVRLESGSLFHALRFTDDEVLALSLGLELVKQSSLGLAETVTTSASRRLQNTMSERLYKRFEALSVSLNSLKTPISKTKNQVPSSLILDIAEAIKQTSRLELSYRSGKNAITSRLIDPYGMVYLGPYWYLSGYCHLRKAVRIFRLDRIRQVKPLPQTFTKPKDFNSLAIVSQGIAVSAKGSLACEIKLYTNLEKASSLIPPTAALLEAKKDFVLLRLRCFPEQLPEIALHLVKLPCSLRVIKPRALKDSLYNLSEKAKTLANA